MGEPMMTTKQALSQAIEDYAVAFNKNDKWIQRAWPVWLGVFEDSHPKAILKGFQSIITTPREYQPKLSDLVGAVKKATVDLGLGATHNQHQEYNLCQDCEYRQGYVRTAAHYTWIAPTEGRFKQGEYYVSTKMNICGCKGSLDRLQATGSRMAGERHIKLQRDPRIELHEFYQTCRDLPTLTHRETMKPEEYANLKQNSGKGTHRFRRIIDTLMSGNQDAIFNAPKRQPDYDWGDYD